MKPSLQNSLVALLIFGLASAFLTAKKPTFEVAVQGIEDRNILKEGVARTEFALMTIETKEEGTAVEKFEIVLARGSNPIEVVVVEEGNSMNLLEFADSAQSGDRLVIDIQAMSGTGTDLSGANAVVVIPVK